MATIVPSNTSVKSASTKIVKPPDNKVHKDYNCFFNIFFKNNKSKFQLDDSTTALSMSGNLVRDLTIPITKNYDLDKAVIGRGSSAQVVIGTGIVTGRKYAIKKIDISRKDIAWRYDREKNIMKDLDHTNIVRLFEVFRKLYFYDLSKNLLIFSFCI